MKLITIEVVGIKIDNFTILKIKQIDEHNNIHELTVYKFC
jgi:hypothetical protein